MFKNAIIFTINHHSIFSWGHSSAIKNANEISATGDVSRWLNSEIQQVSDFWCNFWALLLLRTPALVYNAVKARRTSNEPIDTQTHLKKVFTATVFYPTTIAPKLKWDLQKRPRWDLNPQSPAPEADALSIRPLGLVTNLLSRISCMPSTRCHRMENCTLGSQCQFASRQIRTNGQTFSLCNHPHSCLIGPGVWCETGLEFQIPDMATLINMKSQPVCSYFLVCISSSST